MSCILPFRDLQSTLQGSTVAGENSTARVQSSSFVKDNEFYTGMYAVSLFQLYEDALSGLLDSTVPCHSVKSRCNFASSRFVEACRSVKRYVRPLERLLRSIQGNGCHTRETLLPQDQGEHALHGNARVLNKSPTRRNFGAPRLRCVIKHTLNNIFQPAQVILV